MAIHSRFLLAVAVVALAFAACDTANDDGGPNDGDNDLTPPGLVSATAVDMWHVHVVFDERVQRTSAENLANYEINVSPGGMQAATGVVPLPIHSAVLLSDEKTVALTTDPMSIMQYELAVTGVTDLAGNSILAPVTKSFPGSTDLDTTPPQLVYRSPGPGATNVAVGMPMGLQFSEAVTEASFMAGFSWTSGSGPVVFDAESPDNGVHVFVYQAQPLAYATTYTVRLEGIQDLSGNTMPTTSWTFRTTASADNTPPTVVSSDPADGETGVDINANLSITFSEPVNQTEFEIVVTPELTGGDDTWSNGGKTLTFDPFAPLADDQQYVVTIPPGGIKDLAGNGNTGVVVIKFSTGDALAGGSIAGTITGDSQSDYAGDPTGAYVVAATAPPIFTDDFAIGGFDVAAGNNTYDITNVADGTYYPFAIMDTNDDGTMDPSYGDAVGMYGIDVRGGDLTPDSVTISGGNRITGADFTMVDPSAVAGTISYDGVYSPGFWTVGVGLFDTDNFDPSDPPLYTTGAYWPDYSGWQFISLDGIPDGTYYVGAFMDVNGNDAYDSAVDPAGIHGGNTPAPVVVSRGRDTLGIVITLADPPMPPGTARARGVSWPTPMASRVPALKKIAGEMEKQGSQGWSAR
jgi:hypothetical protein